MGSVSKEFQGGKEYKTLIYNTCSFQLEPVWEQIIKKFNDAFLIHRQVDEIGGGFLWQKELGDRYFLVFIEPFGFDKDGTSCSAICNSLLHQAVRNGLNNSNELTSYLYRHLAIHNENFSDEFHLGADLIFLEISRLDNSVSVLSTGISAILKTSKGVNLFGAPHIDQRIKLTPKKSFKMTDLEKIYFYSDRVAQLPNKHNSLSLGDYGLMEIVKKESSFTKCEYLQEFEKWTEPNHIYDDFTFIGLSFL